MSKKNSILLGVLALLLIAVYIYQGPYSDRRDNKGGDVLASTAVEDLDGLEIEKNATTTVSLAKDEKGWKLADSKEFYIKEGVNEELNDALRNLKEGSVEEVSSSPNRRGEFGTDDSGVKLTLYSGEEKVKELIVGDSGPGIESSYISYPEEWKTYSVGSGISGLVQREQWGDPEIFNTDKEKITNIRFQYPDSEFTIEKRDEGWRAVDSPYSSNISQDKVEEVLNVMTDLIAAGIPEQTFEGTGLDKHLIIVEASGEEENNTLMVGEADEEGLYYAKKAKSDNIYLITEEQRNILKTTVEDLR
ncbi:MAG: DUF4340 domain-containing protein [Patescibacteria group bacterium]